MYQSDTQSASTSKPQSDKCMARRGTLEDSWNEMNSFQGYLQTSSKLLSARTCACVCKYVCKCMCLRAHVCFVIIVEFKVLNTGTILWL